MASFKLRKAKSSANNSPNKHSGIVIDTKIESSPIPTVGTLRLSRLTKFRHNLTRASLSSLHTRRIPSLTPSIAATSLPPVCSPPPASPAVVAALHEVKKDRPHNMDISEQTQPAAASATPPVPFSRLKEIANNVSYLYTSQPILHF
jgi:hypothetical protein